MNPTQSTPKRRPKASEWKPKFLDALKEHGVISYAAHMAGIDRSTAYKARGRSRKFANQWQEALEIAIDKLELEAIKRAKAKSDTLLIFLLKAHRPARYREKYDVKVEDWRSEIVELLKRKLITPAIVRKELGDSLAEELFESAGISIDASGQT